MYNPIHVYNVTKEGFEDLQVKYPKGEKLEETDRENLIAYGGYVRWLIQVTKEDLTNLKLLELLAMESEMHNFARNHSVSSFLQRFKKPLEQEVVA